MNPKKHPLLELGDVSACLHTARDILHNRAKGQRGSNRRRLKVTESAVLDAIGALARQGLSAEESRADYLRILDEERAFYAQPS
jgi:hypothetical protein